MLRCMWPGVLFLVWLNYTLLLKLPILVRSYSSCPSLYALQKVVIFILRRNEGHKSPYRDRVDSWLQPSTARESTIVLDHLPPTHTNIETTHKLQCIINCLWYEQYQWTVKWRGAEGRRGGGKGKGGEEGGKEVVWGRGRQWWGINLRGTPYLLRELFFSSSSTFRSSLW